MAERTHITPEMLRMMLSELMLCASPFIKAFGGGRSVSQERLFQAIERSRALIKNPVHLEGLPLDPDTLLRAYIMQGGNWRNLVAAINRHASEAVIQRYHQEKEQDSEKAAQ